jgi:zinc protease
MQTVILADPSKPIVSFRLVFKSGSVDDPKGKEGLTALTALIMEEGGTRELSSSELLHALYPIAGEISVHTDKEMTAFSGRVHQDNLDRFLKIFTDVLLEPRFDPKEFDRLRTDAVNRIRNQLRGQDDETLGKVALDALLYQGHPYQHFEGGTVEGLAAISLDDVRSHARRVFSQDRLVIGIAGPVDAGLEKRIRDRLSSLPTAGAEPVRLPPVPTVNGRTLIVEKDVISTAISMGYAYGLRRGDPDYYPVAFALSYLGEHRQFQGVLFRELRERRGLNYGDYAYAEHFSQEGHTTLALTNAARSQQDFSLWIRPVEPANAAFATRAAVYFLDHLIKHGIERETFDVVRGFLTGYTRQWDQTDQRRLGYAIDELFCGTPNFLEGFRQAMSRMTPDDVRQAVRRHLNPARLNFVFVAKDGTQLASSLAGETRSPISYPTPKPPDVLQTDKEIEASSLPIEVGSIQIVDAQSFMEK